MYLGSAELEMPCGTRIPRGALNSTKVRAWVSRKSTHLSREKNLRMKKEFCHQRDPLSEEVARKIFRSEDAEKISDRIEST
jgi:hypothetical protein